MINRDRVMQMYRRGKTYQEISAELACSGKQVMRIVQAKRKPIDQGLHVQAKKGLERATWTALALEGLDLTKLAEYIGVSVQYMDEQIFHYLIQD